ncbi:MAG: hypothetical protein AB7O88_06870 [Reyranellaceae bacterium]
MSVSFQFQQDNINNPIIKQEVLEVVASTSRVSPGQDESRGAFWRAASSGRLGSGLGGLFHRGPPTAASLATSTNASLSSSQVVFFLGQTIQFDHGNTDKAYPAYEFMFGGKTYVVRTGGDQERLLASDRKALAINASARSNATGAMNYLLSQTHRHSPTGAADLDPAPIAVSAPIGVVRLPRVGAVAPATLNRVRANSDFENYSQSEEQEAEYNTN